jgi:hypothetical protein
MKAFGNFQVGAAIIGRKIDIENVAALLAMKMAMLMHIGAIAHGGAVEIHGLYQAALNEKIEAVVNGGHGDIRHGLLGAHEDLLRSGVVALLHEHMVNVLALGSETETSRGQARHFVHSTGFRRVFH